MSERGKSGSHRAYRAHGDRHDLLQAAEEAMELLLDYQGDKDGLDCIRRDAAYPSLVGALAVAVRDGLVSEVTAREVLQDLDLKAVVERAQIAFEALRDELRGGA